MDWPKITKGVIIIITVGVILFDIVAAVYGGGDATISAAIYNLSHKYPVIPLAAGILMGHLFFSISNEGA